MAVDGACTGARQGRAGLHKSTSVFYAINITVCMQISKMQDGDVAALCCPLTAQSAHKDQYLHTLGCMLQSVKVV